VVPLATDLWMWAHTTAPPPAAFCRQEGGSKDGCDAELAHAAAVTTRVHIELPTFLAPLHDTILLAGHQLRFMSRLPQTQSAMDSIVQSASRELDEATMLAAELDATLGHGIDGFAHAGAPWDTTGSGVAACQLVWRQKDLDAVQRLAAAGARARASEVDTMLRCLATQRELEQHAALKAQLDKVQAWQQEAKRLEAEEGQRARAARRTKAALLLQQSRAAESRAAQRKVCRRMPSHHHHVHAQCSPRARCSHFVARSSLQGFDTAYGHISHCISLQAIAMHMERDGDTLGPAQAEEQRRREDDALLLHHVEQQDAVARLNALTEDVRHAVLADAELSRREARVAWRLRRWELFSIRHKRLQVLLFHASLVDRS
jgi:hypothetical protein